VNHSSSVKPTFLTSFVSIVSKLIDIGGSQGGSSEPVELPWPEFEAASAGQRPLVLPADMRGVALSLRAMGVDTEILECNAGATVERAREAVCTYGRRIACRGRNYRQVRVPICNKRLSGVLERAVANMADWQPFARPLHRGRLRYGSP